MTPSPKKRERDFESIETQNARRLVNHYLKGIAGIDFERFIREKQQGLLVNGDDGSRHFLDLNLLTPTSCESVTSAVYKTSATVEMNRLKASLDLKTCWRKRHLDSMGLFLLLPDPHAMERKEYKRIDEVIGVHEWKLEQDARKVAAKAAPAKRAVVSAKSASSAAKRRAIASPKHAGVLQKKIMLTGLPTRAVSSLALAALSAFP